MLPNHKKKALAALKRLNGLSRKLEQMIEDDDYCPDILNMALAMQGHIKHLQAQVLESHMHTCAVKRLTSNKNKNEFIDELITVIGLSKK